MRSSVSVRPPRSPIVRSGDEISGDAGYRSQSERRAARSSLRAKRARANPPGDTSEVA
jgi:hypothetical protein